MHAQATLLEALESSQHRQVRRAKRRDNLETRAPGVLRTRTFWWMQADSDDKMKERGRKALCCRETFDGWQHMSDASELGS